MDASSFLKDKVAIVTGAGRGIGRAIARRLGAAGANVVITSRTEDQLDQTRQLIEQEGGQAVCIVGDVTQEADVQRLIAKARSAYGGVDILVNNVGAASLATIDQMTPEVFDGMILANVRTVYLCSRAVWPIMTGRGGGAIVNIASIAAYDAFPGFAAYGACKAFVVAYTRELAKEGAAAHVQVYGVAPGAIETDMLRGPFPDFPADKTLSPDDVAAMVQTVLSPAYHHSSGQTVVVARAAH